MEPINQNRENLPDAFRAAVDRKSEPFKTLVTLGESTTAGGWSSDKNRCWASVLAALISDFQDEPVNFINSGIGANVISTRVPGYDASGKPAASERLQKHVVDHQPDLLVMAYGLNDARGATPAEMFREELTAALDEIREGCDPLVVLVGPFFSLRPQEEEREEFSYATPDTFELFNLVVKQVAREKDCLFCDVLGVYGGAAWALHYDLVHANDVGHRLIAHEIFKTLVQNCSGLAVKTKRLETSIPKWRDESMLRKDYGYVKKVNRRWMRAEDLEEDETKGKVNGE